MCMKNAQPIVLLLAILLFLPMAPGALTTAEAQGVEHRPSAELFVYVGCMYCPYAEDALPGLISSTNAVVLVYHVWSDQAGWDTSEGEALAASYGVSGAPAMMVDGVDLIQGADPMGYGQGNFDQSCEDAYVDSVDGRQDSSSIQILPSIQKSGDKLSLSADIYLDILSSQDMAARFVVYEKTASFQGINYLNVVRDVKSHGAIVQSGKTTFSEEIFIPRDTQNSDNLGLAVMVYSQGTGEVLQSNTADVVQAPTTSGGEVEDEGGISTTNLLLLGVVGVLVVAVVVRWRKV